jgi:hypothetical protein
VGVCKVLWRSSQPGLEVQVLSSSFKVATNFKKIFLNFQSNGQKNHNSLLVDFDRFTKVMVATTINLKSKFGLVNEYSFTIWRNH